MCVYIYIYTYTYNDHVNDTSSVSNDINKHNNTNTHNDKHTTTTTTNTNNNHHQNINSGDQVEATLAVRLWRCAQRACINKQLYIYIYVSLYAYICVYTYICVYIYIYIHMCIHTCAIDAYTHSVLEQLFHMRSRFRKHPFIPQRSISVSSSCSISIHAFRSRAAECIHAFRTREAANLIYMCEYHRI